MATVASILPQRIHPVVLLSFATFWSTNNGAKAAVAAAAETTPISRTTGKKWG